ncbi:MAG: 16S rRNA (uracil(1498)-N(3))-methyltransferase [Vampirovibrio sp.]
MMAHVKRLFLPSSSLPWQTQDTWVLEDAETLHHLVSVQRLKRYDTVVAVDLEQRQVFEARVLQVDKKAITLSDIHRRVESDTTPQVQVTLYASVLKEQAWDVLLQKASELGVHRIQPMVTAHGVVPLSHVASKMNRWQRILRDAALQCESLYIPELLAPQRLEDLWNAPTNTPSWVLMERSHDDFPHLQGALHAAEPSTVAHLWVGPEGGWSADEKEQFQRHPLCRPCHLNARILRAETAALVGLTLLLHGKGRA